MASNPESQAEVMARNNGADELGEVNWNSIQWTTVSAERGTQFDFELPGESFIGLLISKELAFDPKRQKNFLVLVWRGFPITKDGEEMPRGIYQQNCGHKLATAFAIDGGLPTGFLYRQTYVQDIDTGQASPMKDIRVEQAALA